MSCEKELKAYSTSLLFSVFIILIVRQSKVEHSRVLFTGSRNAVTQSKCYMSSIIFGELIQICANRVYIVSVEIIGWLDISYMLKQVAERIQIFVNLSKSEFFIRSELLRIFIMYCLHLP